ncbi:hypothetical protein OLEAN_C24480 [Oleispira antarctica RB-8]|uniref:Uncharacterized protein n=1 Tax=Oleispira antarctica RB-8 TaxID=698738 RepID=R4YUF5_OLEAN|nr:hypothetical protein OLEAN_C24480 [Oleispira antarctica RB-8]
MLSNEKCLLYVEGSKGGKGNDLIINFSQYLGYDCIIEVSSWDNGITWTGTADTDIKTITDISELGVPFVAICKVEVASSLLATFPEGLQKSSLSMSLNT